MRAEIKLIQVFSNGSCAFFYVSANKHKQFEFLGRDHISTKKRSVNNAKLASYSAYKTKYL